VNRAATRCIPIHASPVISPVTAVLSCTAVRKSVTCGLRVDHWAAGRSRATVAAADKGDARALGVPVVNERTFMRVLHAMSCGGPTQR
jgi:hypothetical protein